VLGRGGRGGVPAPTPGVWVVFISLRAGGGVANPPPGPPDAEGWVEVVVPSESFEVLAHALLPLGEFIEVLEPPQLRAQLAATAAAMHARYSGG
ncbi:WYL domain-containing protein, partial [Nocardia abscessus]|uniref:WYL domain-containing protein n=1 Tax=Nocardia abscessus TaxID=120957 RepID=UPI0024583039